MNHPPHNKLSTIDLFLLKLMHSNHISVMLPIHKLQWIDGETSEISADILRQGFVQPCQRNDGIKVSF